jgi:hypothetical protein
MSGSDPTARRTDPALAELERQIAETREQLGRTVEELAAKADVPARARAKANEAVARVRSSAGRLGRHGPADSAGSSGSSGGLSGGSGAHLADSVHEAGARLSHPSEDSARRAYGAAAIGLTAATAGAAVWASRHP